MQNNFKLRSDRSFLFCSTEQIEIMLKVCNSSQHSSKVFFFLIMIIIIIMYIRFQLKFCSTNISCCQFFFSLLFHTFILSVFVYFFLFIYAKDSSTKQCLRNLRCVFRVYSVFFIAETCIVEFLKVVHIHLWGMNKILVW